IWDAGTRKTEVSVKLKAIDQTIPFDSATAEVVSKWDEISSRNFKSLGFDPTRILVKEGPAWNGLEAKVRTDTTNLTKLIVRAMEFASPDADLAIVNLGFIRVDDILPPPVSVYDLLRTVSFGGGLVEVDMEGSLLKTVLEAGRKNRGIGGFLQISASITYSNGRWLLQDKAIEDSIVYKVVMSDFLITGGEANLEF